MAGTEEDLYLVLGLDQGLESTGTEIKKAYRKKALESHPDKRPDDKNAAAEFDKIQKAYEVLGDEKARKAYDDLRKVQRARADRDAQKGAKRQKMMDDLKKREEAFVHERSAEEIAKMKLKAEIARVRQEGLARQKRQAEELAAAQKEARSSSGASASTPGGGESTLLQGATLARTLKVSWDRSREGGMEDYGAEKLKAVFLKFGRVEDIIIKEDVKKKKKGSALVVMASEDGAAAAIGAVCGDLSNPLLVKPAVPGLVPGQGGVKKQGYDGGSVGVNGAMPEESVNVDKADGVNGAVPGESVNGHTPDGVNRHPLDSVNAQGGAGRGTGQLDGSSENHVNVAETGSVNGDQGVTTGGDERGAHGERGSGAGVDGTAPHVVAGINGSQRPNIHANGPPRPLFGGTNGAANPGAFSSAATAASSGSHKDYENVTLMRMRQAAERSRLIRELEEQDAREAEAEKGA